MNLTPEQLDEVVGKLGNAEYGAPAVFELADGREFALTIELDEDTNIRDYETFDSFSKYAYDYARDGREPRPDDMDGNAEKIQVDRGSYVWWQPPADVKRTDEGFAAFRATVRDILECGYCGYVLELRRGTDAMGRPIAEKVASLWGIENIYECRPDSEYGQSIIRDLVAELAE